MNKISRKAYTIKLFVPDGDPESLKIVEKFNWTGIGIEVSRSSWGAYKTREEFSKSGIYLLVGYGDNDSDLPILYIGQGDDIKTRIEKHNKEKEFWDRVIGFTAKDGALNRAHITWIEWALVNRAQKIGRCILDNKSIPNEPNLTPSEKADIQEFLNEILSVLPFFEVKVFEKAKKVEINSTTEGNFFSGGDKVEDTIIIQAQEEGFNEVFLGKNMWYAIRIGGGRINNIKYVAAYQTAPISAITHYSEVESIEAYGDGGKYQLNFKGPVKEIEKIEYGDAKKGLMQSPKYTSIDKLLNAKKLSDLFD